VFRRALKKILKIYFIFLAACCSLLFFFLIGTTLYLGTGHAGHLFQKMINQSIPGTISWTDHSLSLLRGKAVFRHVILKGPKGDLLVRADELAADIILPDLLENTLTFRHVALENPDVRLFIQEDGTVNLAGAFVTPEIPHEEPPAGEQEDTPFNVVIRHGTIKNGSFQYKASAKETILLSGINLELKNGDLLKQTAHVSLKSSSGNITVQDALEISGFQTSARVIIEGDTMSIDNLMVSEAKNSLSANGRWEFTSGDITSALSLIVDGDFLNRSIKGIDILHGSFMVDSTLSGQVTDPLLTIHFRGTDLSYQDIPMGDIAALADYSNGRFNVNRFAASRYQSELNLSGSIQVMDQTSAILLDKPTCDISIHDSSIVLEDFNQDLKGRVAFNGAVAGHIIDPSFEIEMQGNNLSYQDSYIGDVSANFLFDGGKITIRQCDILNKKSLLGLSGSIQVTDQKTNRFLDKPTYDISIHDSVVFLEDFNQKIAGQIAFSGGISGDATHPTGNLSLRGEKVDTGYQAINTIAMELRIADRRIYIDHSRAEISPGEEVEANGWISFQGEYDLEFDSKGISLQNIDQIDGNKWGEAKLNFNFAGAGNIKDPKLSGEINIYGLSVKDKTAEPISLTLDVSNMTARISGIEPMNIAMEIQMETKDIAGSAYFDKIDLNPFFKLAGYEEIAGTLDGRIELAGNITSIETIQARININELVTLWEDNEFLRTENQIISLNNGFVSFSDVKFSLLKEGFMDLKGGADINGLINLTANARIPISIIEPFLDDVYDGEGYIVCTATIGGNFENPDVRADITLDKIGLSTPFLSEKLRDASGRIQLAKDKVIIENISGRFDQGKFNIDGGLSLKNFKLSGSKINISGHAVPVTIPDEMDLLLNAEFFVTGSRDRSKVRGSITILDGVYFRDVNFNLLSLVPKRSRSQELEPSSTHPEFFETMSLDIKVGYRNPFIIENNISFLEVKPDLHIKGSPNRLLMSGRASVDPGGVLKYQGREFEVTRGIIDFLNPYKIEPTLDIEGITTVREWTIFLNISGTPDNLSFALRSDPPEQNNDILYLLAFGKTIRESSDKSKSTSTRQMIAAVMAEELGKNLKDSTVLDTVEVGYTKDSQNESGAEEVKVTVGKELSRQVTIKYGVETRDGQIVQRTTSEYKFLENFLLEAYNDTKGDYGAGLRYRLEFR